MKTSRTSHGAELNSAPVSLKLGILATVAVLFTPVAAFAGDTQTNIQTNKNSAAVVGNANLLLQQAHQNNGQIQVGKSGYPYGYGGYKTPSAQNNVQVNANEGATIGNHNVLRQSAAQNNAQANVDVQKYLPSFYKR